MHDSRKETFPLAAGDDRIKVVEHGLACDWGSWELVEATLRGFAIARDEYDAQLVTLISGQDYPVVPLQDWESKALASEGWIGLAEPLLYRTSWGRRRGEGDDRLTRYTFCWFRSPVESLRPVVPAWVRLPRFAARWWARARAALSLRLEPVFGVRVVSRGRGVHYGFARMHNPFRGEPPWLGSQWLAVRRAELDLIMDSLRVGSTLRKVYRRSIIPDESAIVTALARGELRSAMPPVSFFRWDVEKDTTVTWTIDDLDQILASGSPFCRKVDLVESAELLDALDERSAPGVWS